MEFLFGLIAISIIINIIQYVKIKNRNIEIEFGKLAFEALTSNHKKTERSLKESIYELRDINDVLAKQIHDLTEVDCVEKEEAVVKKSKPRQRKKIIK